MYERYAANAKTMLLEQDCMGSNVHSKSSNSSDPECCYNEAVRQQQGYVNRKKKADNEKRCVTAKRKERRKAEEKTRKETRNNERREVKNGCKSHQPQNWDSQKRYGDVNTRSTPCLTLSCQDSDRTGKFMQQDGIKKNAPSIKKYMKGKPKKEGIKHKMK